MRKTKQLNTIGQSVWLDAIDKDLIKSGQLEKLIVEEGISGITSNPTIFEKAISASSYNTRIKRIQDAGIQDEKSVYEAVAIEDIQDAADLFLKVYEESDHADGFVSMEVSPYHAHNTKATVEEARRLWKQIDRPNVMIKVPGTKEGIQAIKQLLSEGINVNVTLLFSLEMYSEVLNAFAEGLESYQAKNMNLRNIASVASFL